MIDGNVIATIRTKTTAGKNPIGENIETWSDIGTVLGWLDFQSGQNGIQQFNAKIQDTTHVFICDVFRWNSAIQNNCVTSENSRLVINGNKYDVLMIDNPMGINDHVEVFLKYVGGGLGV